MIKHYLYCQIVCINNAYNYVSPDILLSVFSRIEKPIPCVKNVTYKFQKLLLEFHIKFISAGTRSTLLRC